MKKLLFVLGMIAATITAKSQENSTISNDWRLSYEDQNVRLYTKSSNCDQPEEGFFADYVLIKAENKTNSTLELSWYNDAYYDEKCINCNHNNPEFLITKTLQPGEILTGTCGIGTNNGLRVFSKWNKMENQHILTALQLTQVTTTLKNK